jgi:hypothetical protein
MTRLLLLALTCLGLLSFEARAADAVGFTAQPDRCIALHQGQVCYQRVEFRWNTPADGDYCLHQLGLPDAVTCWSGGGLASYNMDFASSESLVYELRARDQRQLLAQVTVEVAWVYRSTRKSFSRWRLF